MRDRNDAGLPPEQNSLGFLEFSALKIIEIFYLQIKTKWNQR